MRIKQLLLLPVLLMLAQLVSGQVNLGISGPVYNAPQAVTYQDSATYSFAVKNFGPNTFNGDIHIYTGVWNDSMTQINVIRIDSLNLANVMNLNPGDSVWVTDEEHYYPQFFKIGTSVVVIWPVASSATTIDSASYTVYLYSGVKVLEVTDDHGLNIFPNPAQEKLVIDAGSGNSKVEQVRILNISGQLISWRAGAGTIDISHLAPGTYLAEINLSGGHRKVYRIIKE